jgi:ribosomal protein S18 acetylase RimI-like enzyme
MTELASCLAFLRALDHRAARRTVPFAFGLAHLDERLPRVWSRNYLVAEQNLGEASAELLALEADRVLGKARLRHRKIEVYDGAVGALLEADFRELGWSAACDLVMVARGLPDRRADVSLVEEVSVDELAPIWAAGIRSEPFGADDEVVRQLVENKRVLMKAIETRFFAARIDGTLASHCDLYSNGQIGQIEAVMTLEQYRNRGLARATVSRALEASRAAGNELTFLLAHRDDWPKELYRKLGFEEVGFIYDFSRAPAPASV